MYRASETETRLLARLAPSRGSENVPSLTAQQNGSGPPNERLRVVRAPGGFAFVEDEPARAAGVQAVNRRRAVSTNSNGNVTFSFVPSQAVAVGQNVTASATNVVEANTSEVSAPRGGGAIAWGRKSNR